MQLLYVENKRKFKKLTKLKTSCYKNVNQSLENVHVKIDKRVWAGIYVPKEKYSKSKKREWSNMSFSPY